MTPLILPLLLIAVVATDGGPLAGLGECEPPPRCMKRNGDFERRLLEVMVEVISLFNWSAGLGKERDEQLAVILMLRKGEANRLMNNSLGDICYHGNHDIHSMRIRSRFHDIL